jgi:hypothetical protein
MGKKLFKWFFKFIHKGVAIFSLSLSLFSFLRILRMWEIEMCSLYGMIIKLFPLSISLIYFLMLLSISQTTGKIKDVIISLHLSNHEMHELLNYVVLKFSYFFTHSLTHFLILVMEFMTWDFFTVTSIKYATQHSFRFILLVFIGRKNNGMEKK